MYKRIADVSAKYGEFARPSALLGSAIHTKSVVVDS